MCGTKFGSFDEVEEDIHGAGFWCPECDGFTPYAGVLRPVDLSVCLETKEQDGQHLHTDGEVVNKLQERLSPLRYPGGKGKMLKQLTPHFPDHVGTMVEPFAGGAAAALAMLFAGRAEQIILNDLDPGVYAFWKNSLENTEEFLDALRSVHGTREEFIRAKEVLESQDGQSSIGLAVAFLVANQLAFSGITKAGIAGDYQRRWSYKKVSSRIRKIVDYKDRITVMQEDALQVIEEFYWNEENFLFIDPPYVMQGKQLYRKWYETDDHERLAALIQNLTSSYPGCAKIVVTYDACPETETYYNFPYVKKIYKPRHYSCGRNKTA